MTTFSGLRFNHLEPRPEMISAEDIAHALSMLCHWGGHCREFFSVAQHCILVSHLAPPELQRWGLLHDAAEAYCGDMIRPMKVISPEYRATEKRVLACIARKFQLPWPEPPELKPYDNKALAMEARQFMPPGALHDGFGNMLDIEIPNWTLVPLNPVAAKMLFLDRLAELSVI